jgi:hypothetical protein
MSGGYVIWAWVGHRPGINTRCLEIALTAFTARAEDRLMFREDDDDERAHRQLESKLDLFDECFETK